MLSRTKESQMDKATKMMREAAKYAQDVAQDARLRADVRAALDHGSKAGARLQEDIRRGDIYTRLASDKKLRRNLRAMLDDLDDAGKRLRRTKSHRLRNIILVVGGAIAAALAYPRVRPWLREDAEDGFDTFEADPLAS